MNQCLPGWRDEIGYSVIDDKNTELLEHIPFKPATGYQLCWRISDSGLLQLVYTLANF